MFQLLILIIAFFCGSVPTAFLLGKFKGIDIRKFGSGNVGATNAFRVLGKGWGLLCLLIDILKGFIPAYYLASFFVPAVFADNQLNQDLWNWVMGVAAILGHVFTPFLNFRGGKGVATSLGVVLAILPRSMLIVFILGLIIIRITGYVSLASITGAALLPILVLVIGLLRPPIPWISLVITLILGAIIIYRHRGNIERLRAGTERRINEKAQPVATETARPEDAR